MNILNGGGFAGFILSYGGFMGFGIIAGILFAVQGVLILLKWLKNREDYGELISSIGFLFGAFSMLLASLSLGIPFIIEDGTLGLVVIGLISLIIFGAISAGIATTGFIISFIHTRSEK